MSLIRFFNIICQHFWLKIQNNAVVVKLSGRWISHGNYGVYVAVKGGGGIGEC